MAYADQGMSRGKMWALGIAVVIHIFLGYALITGLALKIVKHIVEPIKSVNIKDTPPPPDEPPPPPPKDVEIPPFVPPPEVTVASDVPPPITVQSVQAPPPQAYVPPAPPAPPAAVAPPAPTGPTQGAQLDPRSLTTSEDDYPSASQRAGEEGVVTVTLNINAQGRVDSCAVSATSGFPRLDEKTCQISRRFRGKPALQNGTPVASQKVQRIRWQIPKG